MIFEGFVIAMAALFVPLFLIFLVVIGFRVGLISSTSTHLGIGRPKKEIPDIRAQVRAHTNEMERELIASGCMNPVFTETTWEESTPIPEKTPVPHTGLSFVSYISPDYRHAEEYALLRRELLGGPTQDIEEELQNGVYTLDPED